MYGTLGNYELGKPGAGISPNGNILRGRTKGLGTEGGNWCIFNWRKVLGWVARSVGVFYDNADARYKNWA